VKPNSDAAEEFFEYDAEEFLVFLTLLISEGRTPEYSVKGRTEGLHCPPAQSAMPPLHKHECSDKLPQCRQARRTRSEVILLWRNNIPIMIEVMLLPDCCYGDECPPSDPISDPVIKQDALLLERWTLQAVPRQSGDRLIEEKTLLLAVRSYVFFSQLSAWLSASHGVVPRNILYRISAADEDLLWHFSQPTLEHVFPVPNVSQSVALQVRVQSLPRQPAYPTLACSIHTSLPPVYKPAELHTYHNGELPQVNIRLRQGSPLSPSPSRCHSPSPPPTSKAGKWLCSALRGSADPTREDDGGSGTNNSDRTKGPIFEPLRAFKNLSLTEPPRCPSPRLTHSGNETNPLIGCLLQERQEVIARIAQRLNFCDPTAPPLPPGLFASDNPPKAMWGSNHDNLAATKTKEAEAPPCESTGRVWPSPFNTPVTECSNVKREASSPKPTKRDRDSSLIAQAVQDITRLIQERLSVPSVSPRPSRSCSPLHHTRTTTVTHTVRTYSHPTHIPQASHTACQRLRASPQEKLRVRTPSSHAAPPASPVLDNRSRNAQMFSWIHDSSLAADCNRHHSRSPTQNGVPAQASALQDENQAPSESGSSTSSPDTAPSPPSLSVSALQRPHCPAPLRPCNSWKKQNRHSLDATTTKAFHPCTGLPLLSSPVPQRKNHTGYFDLDTSLTGCRGLPWASGIRVCPKREGYADESQQLLSASAPPASLSLLGNFEFKTTMYTLVFLARITSAPGVINLESLGKRGYRVPPSGTIQVTLFNPNKSVVKMFVVVYDLRAMPAGHQTFLRQRTFSVPVRRDANNHISRKPLSPGAGRTLRYLVHLRFHSSKSGKLYLHRDVRLLFSRKSMEVDSGAAYELQSFTESPIDPPFSPRC
uniref:Atos homolog A n=1 Tax=Nothobranchius furzeri TaxID=105023 RepID=A0A8C6NU58_NOTFU